MGHGCPTCGKELRTEQGMRQHHAKVHGESLPNRTCEGCGTDFYDEKGRLAYCDDCNPNAGEHNGNWKDAKETADCRLCDSEFEYYPSDKDGVFCPSCVEEAEDFLGTPSYELREIERVERACEQCGKVSEYLKSVVEYGWGRFCSHECKSRWMSENWRGSDHHSWKGGTDRSWYTGSWARIRKEARERDNHACRLCGKTKAEIGREPDVHHIDPVRTFEDSEDAHRLDNVVCLCPGCHAKAEAEGRGRSRDERHQ
jgi:5-methylcytosine-specific restriction endonuclease McrA